MNISKETDNPLKIRLFVPPSFEGVMGETIFREILNKDVKLEVLYMNYVDFREYTQFEGDADINVVLGFPYHGGDLPVAFFNRFDLPFIDFFHLSTYGKEIEGEYIVSVVNENTDPIMELCTILGSGTHNSILAKKVTITQKAQILARLVTAYRTWTWEEDPRVKPAVRALVALYSASHKQLPNLLREGSLQDTIRNNASLIKGQLDKINEYILRKAETTKTFEVKIYARPTLLKVVYAENHINELANYLLKQSPEGPVIVCVGRATKRNDMFSIRTRGVDAGEVAAWINEGSGKEEVASVYTDSSYAELMGSTIVTQINGAQAYL